MEKKNIIKIITKGEELKNKIGSMVLKHTYENTDRLRIISAYFSMLVEHHGAIHLLIKKELTGSAFTLVRPLHEILFRSHWIYGCATDCEVEKLIEGENIFPKMPDMVNQLDAAYRTDDFWTSLKNASWAAMNDYTHSGIRQLNRRFKEGGINPNYDEAEIIEVLNGTNVALLIMAFFFFNANKMQKESLAIRNMILNYSA